MKITHPKPIQTVGYALLAFAFFATGQWSRAQSSAALLVKPWEPDQTVEGKAAAPAVFCQQALPGDTGQSYDQTTFRGLRAAMPNPARQRGQPAPRILTVTYMDTHSGQPSFPRTVARCVRGGRIIHLSDERVGDGSDARRRLFGRHSLRHWAGVVRTRPTSSLAKKFSDGDALGIGIDYDGHRHLRPRHPPAGLRLEPPGRLDAPDGHRRASHLHHLASPSPACTHLRGLHPRFRFRS